MEICACCVINKQVHCIPFFLHEIDYKCNCKLMCVQEEGSEKLSTKMLIMCYLGMA